MATIVNNPGPERVVAVDSSAGSAGWGVAVIILLAVVGVGIFAWMYYQRPAAPAEPGTTEINVTLPAGTDNSGGANAGGGTEPAP